MYDKTILAGGTRVVTETIPSVRSVAVGVWVHAGSRNEDADRAGISHLIEHMVFKGTVRRRTHQIARRLESVGGYLNAFTSKEHTCFYARALDTHLDRAIDTVCDLVLQPLFPEKELEKEKAVILEEIKMYADSPEDVAFDRFDRIVYSNHALGRPVTGFPETVTALGREELCAYLDRHFTPNRLVVAAAGNLTHDAVVRSTEKALKATTRVNSAIPRTEVGDYHAKDLVENRPIQQAHLILGRRGIQIDHPMRTTVSLLNTILGGGMSSRLNQHIREKYGNCYNIFSFLNLYSDTGDAGVYIGTDPAWTPRARKLILRELDRLAQNSVSPRSLEQAKSQVTGHMMLGLESTSTRMQRIARQELLFGRFISLDEVLDELTCVTTDDIQTAAQMLHEPDAWSTVLLLPQD